MVLKSFHLNNNGNILKQLLHGNIFFLGLVILRAFYIYPNLQNKFEEELEVIRLQATFVNSCCHGSTILVLLFTLRLFVYKIHAKILINISGYSYCKLNQESSDYFIGKF